MVTGVLLVGKKKTDDKVDSPQAAPVSPQGKEEYTEHVKLRRPFKLRLQHVAQDAGVSMGKLIEDMMKEAINREYKRITDKNQGEG